jgi:hypothetical protein
MNSDQLVWYPVPIVTGIADLKKKISEVILAFV